MLFIQRLFRDAKKFWVICNAVVAVMAMWTCIAVLMVSAGCTAPSTAPRIEAEICPGISARYQAVAITDALTELVLVLMPAYLVWQLQMATPLKLQVITVFALRLPLIPVTFLALTRWNHSLHSSNPGVDRASAIMYQQSELCVSLIAGTIPCLKSFLRSFDAGSGLSNYTAHNGYGSSGANGSYRMRSLKADGSAKRSQHSEVEDSGEVIVSTKAFESDNHKRSVAEAKTNNTAVLHTAPKGQEEDATSRGSQELFIRRDVQFEVRSENA